MADERRLTATLADSLGELRQRGWRTSELYWARTRQGFIHAWTRVPGGVDEVLVLAEIGERGDVQLHRFLLLEGRKEWLECDERAFLGFLETGPSGLKEGRSERVPTTCRCEWMVHRSGRRAYRYARELARRYGKTGIQRPYRCHDNPRAFHLTLMQKGSDELIPDAYLDSGVHKK